MGRNIYVDKILKYEHLRKTQEHLQIIYSWLIGMKKEHPH